MYLFNYAELPPNQNVKSVDHVEKKCLLASQVESLVGGMKVICWAHNINVRIS